MCRDVKTLHQSCGCTVVRTQHCQQYYDSKSQEKEKAKGFFSRLLSSPRKSKSCKRGAMADIHEASDGLCGKCYANSVRTKGKIVQGDNGPRIVLEGIGPSLPQSALMKETNRHARGPVTGTFLYGSSLPRKPAATTPKDNAVQQLGTPSRGPLTPPKHIQTYAGKPLPPTPTLNITPRKLVKTRSRDAVPHKASSSQNKPFHAETTQVRRPTPSEELRGPGWKSDKLYFTDELIDMGWGRKKPRQNERKNSTGPELKSDKLYFTDEIFDLGYESGAHYSEKGPSTHSQGSNRQADEIKLWPDRRTPRRPKGPNVPVRIPLTASGSERSRVLPHASGNLDGSRSNLSRPGLERVPSAFVNPVKETEAQRPRRHIDSYYYIGANKAISAMPGFFGPDGSTGQVDPIMNMINDTEGHWNQASKVSSRGRQQTHQRPQTRGRRLL